jgi:ubiquinone/menaquinone biosynthesis C-methylase UbiE
MFTKPEKCIVQLNLREGMKVADFGAGAGFYTRALSNCVGNTGKVYAIEIQKDLIKKLESEIKDWKASNIDCIWGDVEKKGGTKIADHILDAVVVSNLLFQVEDILGLVDEVKRVLKNGGHVLLIDWESKEDVNLLPRNFVTEDKAKEFFQSRGFKFVENISVGPHHYGIIFKHD